MNNLFLKNFFLSHWWLFMLAVITCLSYVLTLDMYFWVDDWGMAYKMRYVEADIPNFGPGLFGEGAYRYNTTPFALLYPFLGFNAKIYFLIGLLFYFIAVLAVYGLGKEIFRKHTPSLFAAMIFASGYIGSYAMYRLSNSYQLVHTTIAMCLIAIFLIRHFRTGKIVYYLLSLLIFIATLEFLFLRTHGLYITILIVSIFSVYTFKLNNRPSLLKVSLKQIPFLLAWVYMYFLDPRNSKEYDGFSRSELIPRTLDLILNQKHFELINNLMITITSTIVPDRTLFSIYNFIEKTIHVTPIIILGMPIIIAILVILVYFLRRKLTLTLFMLLIFLDLTFYFFLYWSSIQKSAVWLFSYNQLFISSTGGAISILLFTVFLSSKFKSNFSGLLFGFAWIIANVAIYFIYTPNTNLASNSRYLIPAFIGSSIFLASILLNINRKLSIVLLGILCSVLIYYTNDESRYIVDHISVPVQNHYSVLRNTVTSMDDQTIFYFEAADDSKFGKSELGGIPHLGIPLVLNYQGQAKIALSYNELFFLLQERNTDLNNIHTFFAKGDSLENTTSEFALLATSKSEDTPITNWTTNIPLDDNNVCCKLNTIYSPGVDGTVSVNPLFEADVNSPSIFPNLLTLNVSTKPLDINNLMFPIFNLTEKFMQPFEKKVLENQKSNQTINYTSKEVSQFLLNEWDRIHFMNSVQITASSMEKTREDVYMKDGDFSFGWEAKSIDWRRNKQAVDLVFSFKQAQMFSRLIWVNHNVLSTPVVYTISSSNNGKDWKVVGSFKKSERVESQEIVIDEIEVTNAKFFKMSIEETYGGEIAPALAEVWMSRHNPPSSISGLNSIRSCILCYAQNSEESNDLIEKFMQVATIKVSWYTDKNDKYIPENVKYIPINMDGNIHKYEVLLPPQGKRFKKIRIEAVGIPSEFILKSSYIRPLSLKELNAKNVVHKFAK